MSAPGNSGGSPPDTTNKPTASEDIKRHLNHETAKISWLELQKFYATGAVIAVKTGLDLLQVAEAFHRDNKVDVQRWLADGSVYKVDDQQAQRWFDHETVVWSVVLAPWVLVQEIIEN